MRVVLTRAAIADLVAIRAYIREHNPAAATRIAAALEAACTRLEALPERGRPGRVAGTRELIAVRPYVIVYQVRFDHNVVRVLRIWHTRQDRA